MTVDDELRAIAERSAARYTDALLTAQGWTRAELVDAIHNRLRNKYAGMRDTGQLIRDKSGQIRFTTPGDDCPTDWKKPYPSRRAAKSDAKAITRRFPDRGPLYPYECDSGGHWHLTSSPPAEQRRLSALVVRRAQRRGITPAPPPEESPDAR